MDENTQRSYYGSMEDFKQKEGVAYHMLDEYLIRSVDQLAEKFRRELQKEMASFRKETLYSIKEAITLHEQKIAYLLKNISALAKELEVKIPEFKQPKVIQPPKKPQRRDDFHDNE